jgi:hypothetical protein
MSSLTGQQINQSYQGLIKLADSSSGITQSLQSVQDGLGNNTGLRLAIDQLEVPNIQSFVHLKGQYYGPGFAATAPAQLASGTQNVIISAPFYDGGLYSYSAATINIPNATSTSDTLEFAFYTSQLINPNGLFPHTPVLSGLTATTTSTGQQTITFPTPLSFSGYGAGVYWIVYKISNSGVQPTVRFGSGALGGVTNATFIYGSTQAFAANTFSLSAARLNGNFQVFSGTTTFDNPFASNLDTTQTTTASVAGPNLGFILHTI